MKRLLQAIYYYTRTERIGILVLCSLSIAILFVPRLFPLIRPPVVYDFTNFEAQIAALQPSAPIPERVERFPFDPNEIGLEAWQQLGVSEKVARTILKFRKKGGRFYGKEDLQKIYGLAPHMYDSLEPYIHISAKSPKFAAAINKEGSSPTLFPFNPNTVSGEELRRLGLSEKLAKTWVNFRNKGGVFRRPEDIKKIYGLSEKRYEELSAFISIPKPLAKDSAAIARVNIPTEVIPASYERVPVAIDINQSEAADWEQLKGIGPAYARRILNFRERLGGFISIDQVAETYHLPDSTFQQIRSFLHNSPIFRPIQINHVDAKTLQSHPFLNWKEANAIVNYRHQHGKFSQVNDLRALHALSEATILKIGPYLSFE